MDYLRVTGKIIMSGGVPNVKGRKKNAALKTTAQSIVPMRKFHYVGQDPTKFGQSSPKWTISGGRQEPANAFQVPGPGSYVQEEIVTKRSGTMSVFRPDRNFQTATSNIDFGTIERFPQQKPVTIGKRDELKYYVPSQIPEPVYVIPKGLLHDKWKTCRISERVPDRTPDQIPSPSRYDPIHPTIVGSMAHTLPRAKDREDLVNDMPGPGSYQLTAPVKTYTRWSERLMVKSNRWHPPPDPNARPWRVKEKKEEKKKETKREEDLEDE